MTGYKMCVVELFVYMCIGFMVTLGLWFHSKIYKYSVLPCFKHNALRRVPQFIQSVRWSGWRPCSRDHNAIACFHRDSRFVAIYCFQIVCVVLFESCNVTTLFGFFTLFTCWHIIFITQTRESSGQKKGAHRIVRL